MHDESVKEMQGLYGPYTLTERVVQKIWLKQEFDATALVTVCGQTLQVQHPGRWNLLGGPDFKDARLVLNGESIVGDVEVHFSPSDWYAHQHETNPEFNRVVLHVVLYPDREGAVPVKTLAGNEPAVLTLMSLLDRDLEAYATDEALLEMEKVDDLEWVAAFLEKPVEQRLEELKALAKERWEYKLAFARKRLSSASWEDACHQMCLEVLGYSRNRAPMARLALRYPLAEMPTRDPESLYTEETGSWKLSGVRPVNHPQARIQQYLGVLNFNSSWPSALREILVSAPALYPSLATGMARKQIVFPSRANELRFDLFNGLVGESRFNTMMVDGFFPLASAAGVMDSSLYWWHWWVGDYPDAVRRFLKHTGLINSQQPICNGLVQGALALFMSRGN